MSVAAAKKGLRQYLATTPGLTSTDEVTVRSADITPEEMTPAIRGGLILFGNVTVAESQAGLQTRAETPTMACWAVAVRPGSDEDAIDAARDRADELLALVKSALASDSSAAGTVRPPGRVTVVSGGLEETPVDWSGAARRADRAFSLSWTSHS